MKSKADADVAETQRIFEEDFDLWAESHDEMMKYFAKNSAVIEQYQSLCEHMRILDITREESGSLADDAIHRQADAYDEDQRPKSFIL